MRIIGPIIMALAIVAIVSFGVFILIANVWMMIFVNWLRFDYVTASNIYFIFTITGIVLTSLLQIRFSPVPLIFAVLFAPLLLSTGLSVYESLNDPTFSNEMNVVATYRQAISVPVTFLTAGISKIGPMFGETVRYVEAQPLLLHIVSTTISGLLTGALTAMFSKR